MSTPTVDTPPQRGWRARTRESRLGTMAVLAVTAVLVFGGVWFVNNKGPAKGAAAGGISAVKLTGAIGSPPKVGKPAQDFTVTTVDGQQVSLSGLRGHPVWLTFAATWCAACRAEAADIEAAYEKAKPKGLVVLQIFITEDNTTVKGYADRIGITFTTAGDPETRIASMYRVLGIPAHFFIDPSGVLRLSKSGSLSPTKMDAAIAEITR